MKNLFLIISLITSTMIVVPKTYAQNASGSSASLQSTLSKVEGEDIRVKIISDFLEKYSSPLTHYAKDFVETADLYNLDWRLVASISGVESTFGKHIPYNSYNGWGWGIYENNIIYFSSWTDGIETVSKGLRGNYINKWKATNVYEIGRIYAADPNWASKVDFFMQKITEFQYQNLTNDLSISL